MTRRKSKPQPRRKPIVGPATRREEGLRAFRQGNYDAAIEMWEQMLETTDNEWVRKTAAQEIRKLRAQSAGAAREHRGERR